MTCHELRPYFEDPLRIDAEFPREAEHLAHCTECARFVEARHELGTGLRLVCESAPEPSAALEAVVLANYRRRIIGNPPLVRSRTRRWVVCWTAAAAAMLALAAVLLHHPAETGDFELNDGVGAAANGAAGDLGKKREQGSLDKRCFLAENATAFRSTSTTGSATGGHEESSFRRFSQLDVL